ncbi:MAG: YdeI/OmpD-associated family protein [Bryobacteraceae bacterium]|nr:YdeI/OmpD-associated family protein [Bryobacteraceae bacterium]
MGLSDYLRVTVRSRADWRAWLEKNHQQPGSIWLVTYKKSSGGPHVPYGDIVEEALCFGWIDSRPAKLDDERSMLLLSPRKRRSAWSALNKERVARMEAAGLMHAAGRKKIEVAKADGSWDALNEVDQLIVPEDLRAALAARNGAAKNFEAFPRSVKRGILDWIRSARREETRAKRVVKTAELAAENRRAQFGN